MNALKGCLAVDGFRDSGLDFIQNLFLVDNVIRIYHQDEKKHHADDKTGSNP
jgi:hypothetical protein